MLRRRVLREECHWQYMGETDVPVRREARPGKASTMMSL